MTNLIDYAKIPTDNFTLEQMQENAFLSINALNNALQGFSVEELQRLETKLKEIQDELETDIAEIRALAAQVTALSSSIAANTVLANNAKTRADEAYTLANTHSTDIANNTASIAGAVTKAEAAEVTAKAAEATADSASAAATAASTAAATANTKVNVIRNQFVQNLTLGLNNRISFALSNNGTVGSLNTYIPTKSDWNEDTTTSDAYIQNKPTTITSTERTVVGRIPTTAPPNNNILIGDGNGNLIYKDQAASTIPVQTFHYLDYDFTTGEAAEKYAEDGETVTILTEIEYQNGFIQHNFELKDDGTLHYVG